MSEVYSSDTRLEIKNFEAPFCWYGVSTLSVMHLLVFVLFEVSISNSIWKA